MSFFYFITIIMLMLPTFFVLSETTSVDKIPKYIESHPSWKLLDRGEDCGYSIAERIIGGTKASLGQYPWLVRLGYTSIQLEQEEESQVDEFGCGGVIISEKYILSAAHCAQTETPMSYVRAGEYNTTTDPDCVSGVCAPPVQDIDIDKIICHPNYTTEELQHDICLIRLQTPIEFNDFVAPICMPSYDIIQNTVLDRTIMEVAGWGLTDAIKEQSSDVLQTLKVPGVPHEFCELKYSGHKEIGTSQICAGGEFGKDSCRGDSGGPLMKPFSVNGPPRYFVLGVVSYGPQKCGATDTPGVYTLVSKYWDWILDNIHE